MAQSTRALSQRGSRSMIALHVSSRTSKWTLCSIVCKLGASRQGVKGRVWSLPFRQLTCCQLVCMSRWCEHDPLQLWDSVCLCVEGALAAAQKATGDVRVVAVGITNQRETTLVWDRHTGQPLHNAVVWHDSRTAAICRSVTADLGAVRSLALPAIWRYAHSQLACVPTHSYSRPYHMLRAVASQLSSLMPGLCGVINIAYFALLSPL